MNVQDNQARIDELNQQIAALEANPLPNEDEHDEQYDRLTDERDTLLVNSWRDENGLYTGALDYIAKNLRLGEDEILHRQCAEGEFFGETFQQVGLFHDRRKAIAPNDPMKGTYRVCYQDVAKGHYVEITQFEATVRVEEGAKPYRIYRPFRQPDGSIRFRLVREVVVTQHDVDGAPAYLNYLMVKADGKLFDLLVARGVFDDDRWQEMFMEHVLGERRLPNFNSAPTQPVHMQWLERFLAALEAIPAETTLEEIEAVVEPLAKELHALTAEVSYFYDERQLADEEDDRAADRELDEIDSSKETLEVGMF